MTESDFSTATPQKSAQAQILSRSDTAILLLLALSPLIFAISSWRPSEVRSRFDALSLSFSLPITAIEIVTIIFAMFKGVKVMAAVRQMPIWCRIALGLLVCTAVGTTLFVARNQGPALIRTYAWAVHLLFGFSLWGLFRTRWESLRPLLWPGVVGGTCLYIIAVALYVLAIPDERSFDWRFFGLGVIHIRQVGFYSVVGAGAALGLAAAQSDRLRYWTAVAAASFLLALSFWSGTRGSLVALVAAFAAGLAILAELRKWRAIAALAISFVAGGLMSLVHTPPHSFYGIFRISQSTAVAGADELATGRLQQWTASAQAVAERPLFGFGESQYGVAVPAWSAFNHPHNIFLQILIQWGIVGFVCFFAIAAFTGWHFVIAAKKGGPGMLPAFLVAGGVATMSLYEGSLYHPYPIMMLTISIAFVLSSHHREQS